MRAHNALVIGLSGVAMLAAGGCSSDDDASNQSTVEMQADYPGYETSGMVEEATLIIEGRVLSSTPTVLLPRFEGDTPEENPLFGLSEEEKAKAISEDSGIAATAVTLRVDVLHKGVADVGQEVTIIQTGGVVDGVSYEVSGQEMLAEGEEYLLFATDGFDGTFTVLGGSAGAYVSSVDDTFIATTPDTAPAQEFTSTEVESLIE